jgi:hypothetical protein
MWSAEKSGKISEKTKPLYFSVTIKVEAQDTGF